MKRRDFLRLMGVLSGTTMLSSCGSREKSRKLVSFVMPPEEGVLPGEASYHPSTCAECPAGCGLQVRVREGWPVKLEGSPGHPVNDGGLCIRGQSSLTRLYHPERLKTPMVRNRGGNLKNISWEEAFFRIAESLSSSEEKGIKNAYLSGRTTGSLSRIIDMFCEKLGILRLPEFEIFSHSPVRQANHILFGEKEMPHYRIEEADFLLTVGTDIIETFITPVCYARKLARAKEKSDFRWFHVEPHQSLTGANANKRFALNPGKEKYLLSYLLWELMEKLARENRFPIEIANAVPRVSAGKASRETGIGENDVKELAANILGAKVPLLIAGGVSTAHPGGLEVAVIAGLIHWITDGTSGPVDFSAGENYAGVGTFDDMERLSGRLESGEVGVLFVSRTNPARALPPGYGFREKMRKAALTVGMYEFPNETMEEADLVLPLSHSIESWGDGEPRKGVGTLFRPVMKPLYDTLAEGEILFRILQEFSGEYSHKKYRDYLFDEWGALYGEDGRRDFLEKGFILRDPPGKAVSLNNENVARFFGGKRAKLAGKEPVLILAPSIRTFDGRSSDLPLLSEIPDPLTTISYGPWLSISEETARNEGLRDRDRVDLYGSGLSGSLPVKIQPGLKEGVFMAYVDTFKSPPLQIDAITGEAILYFEDVRVTKTASKVSIPILSGSFSQEGRGVIPHPVHSDEKHHGEGKSLYPEHHHDEYSWAIVIDLELCTGCAACVASCYVENNVPIVGRRDHVKGREMSWLRIEPYYDKGKVEFIPMLCQQCHSAPCETVCPVYAAYHNPEGLNVQVYNRCVGTRYCSNNCPYKVRRFNWFKHRWKKPLNRMLNPDVSVRGAGVMEKCTFCIQRIRHGKDSAKDEARKVRDGEVTTACAQSCPTGAIFFGNILDKGSRVYRLSHSRRAYRVFESLGTDPSVYYLKKKEAGEVARHE